MEMTKFKVRKVRIRDSGMKGLNQIFNLFDTFSNRSTVLVCPNLLNNQINLIY